MDTAVSGSRAPGGRTCRPCGQAHSPPARTRCRNSRETPAARATTLTDRPPADAYVLPADRITQGSPGGITAGHRCAVAEAGGDKLREADAVVPLDVIGGPLRARRERLDRPAGRPPEKSAVGAAFGSNLVS